MTLNSFLQCEIYNSCTLISQTFFSVSLGRVKIVFADATSIASPTDVAILQPVTDLAHSTGHAIKKMVLYLTLAWP